MAMSLEKLDAEILLLADASRKTIVIRRASAPTPALMQSLGPLTNKVAKDATVRTAVALNHVFGQTTDHHLQEAVAPLRLTVDRVASKILTSHGKGTSSALLGVTEILKRMEPVGLNGSIEAAKKLLPDTQQTEIWAKVIDATLATALTMVPFAGPILASFCLKGLNGAIASGAGMATGHISGSDVFNLSKDTENYNSNIKAGTTGRGGAMLAASNAPTNFLGQIDVSKATPGSLIVSAIRTAAEKKRNADLNRLTNTNYPLTREDASFRENWHNTFDRIMNPVTQDQVAQNKILDSYKLKLNMSGADMSAGADLAETLRTPSKTVEAYIKKVGESLKISIGILEQVIDLGIMASFGEELDKYKREMDSFAVGHGGLAPFYPYTGTPADRAPEWHLALLIVAYYYNVAIKSARGALTKTHPLIVPFTSIGCDSYLDPSLMVKGPGTASLTAFKSPTGAIVDKDVNAFKSGRSMMSYSTQSTLSTSTMEPIQKINLVAQSISTEATSYVDTVKNAMAKGVTQALFRSDNTKFYTEIITVFGAANVIVNSVWKASLSGKTSSNFTIPIQAVKALATYELVNMYSTWNKKISDKDKLGKIGAQISQDGKSIDWNPSAAKLRWYDGTFAGASDSEKLMLYLFARAATDGINLFNLFTGVDSWKETKASLHQLIAEINEAAHKAEWQAVRR